MGLPVTVYRWDDVGAPQLSASPKPSEVIDVLKACLVNGYGDKTPLGWSVSFEDIATSKIVFTNDVSAGGSGGCVQFWSENGTNNPSTRFIVRSATSMLALDSFVNPSYMFQHYYGTSNNQWVIVGTSCGFYVFPHASSKTKNYLGTGAYEVQYFVGDIDSAFPNDLGRFTLWAQNVTGDLPNVNYSHALSILGGGDGVGGALYGVDGNSTKVTYYNRTDALGLINSDAENPITLESSGITPVLLPVMLVSTSTATDHDGVKTQFSSINPYFRGILPGLTTMNFHGYNTADWPTERVINGSNYQLLRGYTLGTWLNIDEWY
jgi:hypothetical protein